VDVSLKRRGTAFSSESPFAAFTGAYFQNGLFRSFAVSFVRPGNLLDRQEMTGLAWQETTWTLDHERPRVKVSPGLIAAIALYY